MTLEIDSVDLEFDGNKILYGIYLKSELGKVTGILGRNGSGKTSLLRILFGDLRPKYKNIRINGKCLPKPLYRTGKIGYLPQHPLLPKHLRVKRVFELFNLSWEQFIIHFESFIEYSQTRIKDLSSGEVRVIETYVILLSNKEIILLDEPFSFIAPVYVEKFKSLINSVRKRSIIILTDHFYKDILTVSDTVYLLKNGCSKKIEDEKELKREGYTNQDLIE
ncbi:ATP-binding cassette domain-containing protein [Arenibacter sp. F20364]|uniref:ATP-binding cassette domain-containing protein n=1 Tax=Arenibacter sp. F20364 TaxID=2926415 RepID=UPI001FF1BE22|nr:ATP-binding cassette domain-containing protein [Arenibacter sp. F20364]MCK0190219.1 ATP-binding cassette domain-containing protein [Arenibacter sp. F20364]